MHFITVTIDLHSLDDPLQSAYKPGNSTETALLKVTNDILIEHNANREVFLISLDLPAAFDTTSH